MPEIVREIPKQIVGPGFITATAPPKCCAEGSWAAEHTQGVLDGGFRVTLTVFTCSACDGKRRLALFEGIMDGWTRHEGADSPAYEALSPAKDALEVYLLDPSVGWTFRVNGRSDQGTFGSAYLAMEAAEGRHSIRCDFDGEGVHDA